MPGRPGRPKGLPKTGGRAKGTRNIYGNDVRTLAQPYAELAIAVLAAIMETSEHDACRVAAARELLDRAYGRPLQPLANDPDNPLPAVGLVRIFALPDNERDAKVVRLAMPERNGP